MKHFKLILIGLITLVIVLIFLIICLPADRGAENTGGNEIENNGDTDAANVENGTNEEGADGTGTDVGEVYTTEVAINTEDQPLRAEFDLKYDKYLIAAPYTYQVNGEARVFQFNKMMDAIDKVELEYEKGLLTYIGNYKNQNGWAPYYKGQSVDAAGNSRSAAAPAYPDLEDLTEFTYLEDGTLVRLLSEDEEYAHVAVILDNQEYYVPQKYVMSGDCLTELSKVIVVDRNNQNIASFEKHYFGGNNGRDKRTKWKVVSYSLATTGKIGKYHQPTPLGFYYAVEKKPKFYYVKDGTTELEGSAPYAIRFSAGAYIHGVAVPFKYSANGSRIEGTVEYSKSIGTVPLSHKCVRNYTSHAKFLYDWYVHGETIVIVIE